MGNSWLDHSGEVHSLKTLWTTAAADSDRRRNRLLVALLLPLFPLIAWYAYHYARTGYVFGNPEFFRYNVAATLNPLRFCWLWLCVYGRPSDICICGC